MQIIQPQEVCASDRVILVAADCEVLDFLEIHGSTLRGPKSC